MKIVSCDTADSKPVKQEVNSTVILPPLVFPELSVFNQWIDVYLWVVLTEKIAFKKDFF